VHISLYQYSQNRRTYTLIQWVHRVIKGLDRVKSLRITMDIQLFEFKNPHPIILYIPIRTLYLYCIYNDLDCLENILNLHLKIVNQEYQGNKNTYIFMI